MNHRPFLRLLAPCALTLSLFAPSIARADDSGWTDDDDAPAAAPPAAKPPAEAPEDAPTAKPEPAAPEKPVAPEASAPREPTKAPRKIVVAPAAAEPDECGTSCERRWRSPRAPSIGFHFGAGMRGTGVDGRAGAMWGLEAALRFGGRFSVGVAGWGLGGLENDEVLAAVSRNPYPLLGFAYGGLQLRYDLASRRSPVIPSVGLLLGKAVAGQRAEDGRWNEDASTRAEFGVVEPSFTLAFPVTRYGRFVADVSYRWLSGDASVGGVTQERLEGLSAGLGFQLGWF